MNELVHVENNQIIVAEEAMQLLHDFQVEKARMELKEKELKEALLQAMENNGITKFENDLLRINYKAPSIRKSVDTDALKEQGLYEAFLKEVPVKASVTLNWK